MAGSGRELQAAFAQGLCHLVASEGVDPPLVEVLFEDEARHRPPVNVGKLGLLVIGVLRQELNLLEEGDHLVRGGPACLDLVDRHIVRLLVCALALPVALSGEGLGVVIRHRFFFGSSRLGEVLLPWATFPPRETRAKHRKPQEPLSHVWGRTLVGLTTVAVPKAAVVRPATKGTGGRTARGASGPRGRGKGWRPQQEGGQGRKRGVP